MSFLKLIKTISIVSAFTFASGCVKAMPHVVIETELGVIVIEVYEDRAPITSEDFLYYVDNGLYDGEGFYRSVTPDTDPLNMDMQIVQGGRLDVKRVSAQIDLETTALSGLTHKEGAVSVARSEQLDSGSAAYFFISIGDNKFLDYGGERATDGQGFAVFGQVVKGMDVVRKIQTQETWTGTDDPLTQFQHLITPVAIKTAYRE